MDEAKDLRERLVRSCDDEYGATYSRRLVSSDDISNKLIREGLRAARKIIEEAPLSDDPRQYLVLILERLKQAIANRIADRISDDGWPDEDCFAAGGLATIRNYVEKQIAELP